MGVLNLKAAILDTLAETWDANPVVADPRGNRIFARYVKRSGPADDWGWDDWSVAGVLVPGQTRWINPTVGYEYEIERAIAAGQSSGRIEPEPGLLVWWCLSTLDGPPGERVGDWLNIRPTFGT